MAWVTWRQHRPQLLAMAGLVLGVALAALVTDLPIRAAYHRQALASCLPPATRSGCDIIVSHFRGEFAGRVAVARWLMVLPGLAGLLVGAPLVAREFEHGTYRLAWTQSVSRRRWLLSKTSLLALVVVVGAAVLAGVATWWRVPLDAVGGRMSPGAFDIEGLVVPAYAFFALGVGVLAGLLLRRTIAAVSVALAAFVAVRLGVEKLLRPHFLPPLHRTVTGLTQGQLAPDWILNNSLVDAVGRQISTSREDLAILHAQQAGIDPQGYFLSLGWRRVITFQPPGRFWAFQGIEAAIFVVLGLLAVGLAVTLVRRTPA